MPDGESGCKIYLSNHKLIFQERRGRVMRNERKKRRTFLARFMVLMMILNLLSGVNPSVVRAEEYEYYKNGDRVTENGITISEEVTAYHEDEGTYDINLLVEVDIPRGRDSGKAISDGTIVNPMSEYVEYVEGSITTINIPDELIETGSAPELDYSDNTLNVKKIELGAGQELEYSYKVKLKENWQDGEFHKTSGETVLSMAEDRASMTFNVPEIKADEMKTSVQVVKMWFGTPEDFADEVDVELYSGPDKNNQQPVKDENDNILTKETQSLKTTFADLPKYKDGKEIVYTVREKGVGDDGTITVPIDGVDTELDTRKMMMELA